MIVSCFVDNKPEDEKVSFRSVSSSNDSLNNRFESSLNRYADELIVAKEHFAEIGDDLDFTFVGLIDGIDPIWTYRRPKPPTPPPREPSPPKIIEAAAAAAGAVEGVAEGLIVATEAGEVLVAAAPAAPKEPSPFELAKHFPPDGAEVPFVKSYEDPSAPVVEKAPTPAPVEATPEPVAEPEAPAEEAPAAEEAAPAEEAPAEAAPAEEAPAAEA